MYQAMTSLWSTTTTSSPTREEVCLELQRTGNALVVGKGRRFLLVLHSLLHQTVVIATQKWEIHVSDQQLV
jgi:hypothetical protein